MSIFVDIERLAEATHNCLSDICTPTQETTHPQTYHIHCFGSEAGAEDEGDIFDNMHAGCDPLDMLVSVALAASDDVSHYAQRQAPIKIVTIFFAVEKSEGESLVAERLHKHDERLVQFTRDAWNPQRHWES